MDAMRAKRPMADVRTSAIFDVADYAAQKGITIAEAYSLPEGVIEEYIALQRTKAMIEFCHANIEHLHG